MFSVSYLEEEGLYRMYRMTYSGKPYGRPMVSFLGSDVKSPIRKVLEQSVRKSAIRHVRLVYKLRNL